LSKNIEVIVKKLSLAVNIKKNVSLQGNFSWHITIFNPHMQVIVSKYSTTSI